MDVKISGYSKNELNSEISLVFRNEDEMPLASYPFCDEKGKLFTLNGSFEISAVIRIPKTL